MENWWKVEYKNKINKIADGSNLIDLFVYENLRHDAIASGCLQQRRANGRLYFVQLQQKLQNH